MSSKILKFFPTPDYLKVPRIGLDVTDESVRFVGLKETKRGYELYRFHEEALPPQTVTSGKIINFKALSEVLKVLKQKSPTNYISASLPEEETYLFNARVMGGNRKIIRQNIEFILEENVPLPPTEVLFEFDVIHGSSGQSDYVDVAVSAIPSKVVEEYSSLFLSAGFIPYSLETEGRSLTRSLISPSDKSAYIIANVNKECAGLFIISGGAVRFSSTIRVGSLGNGSEWAEAIKNELRKLYSYWSIKDGFDKGEGRILVCGERAGDTEIIKAIGSSGIKFVYERANVWTNTCPAEVCLPDISFEDSMKYAVAIGLALKDMESDLT